VYLASDGVADTLTTLPSMLLTREANWNGVSATSLAALLLVFGVCRRLLVLQLPPPVVAIQAFATPALVSVEHVEGVETHALLTVPVADAIYLHHVSPLVGATSLHLPVSEGFCSEVYATSLDLAILQLPLFLGLLRA